MSNESLSFCQTVLSRPVNGVQHLSYTDVTAGTVSALFMIFLLFFLVPSVKKLRHEDAPIVATYYVLLWVITILNVLRPWMDLIGHASLYFGTAANGSMMFIEISVLLLLPISYKFRTVKTAIMLTLIISFIIASILVLIQVVYPKEKLLNGNFKPGTDNYIDQARFWFAISVIFAVFYAAVLVLRASSLKHYLPVRNNFYYYVTFVLVLDLLKLMSTLLVMSAKDDNACGDTGACFFMIYIFTYYCLYGPVIYMTFLRDFFKEEPEEISLSSSEELEDDECDDVPKH